MARSEYRRCPPRELIHDHEHPVAPEHDGLASKEIHAPQAAVRQQRRLDAPKSADLSELMILNFKTFDPLQPADLSDKTIGDLDVSRDGLDGSAAAHPNKPGNPATTLLFPSSEIGSSPR